LDVKNKHYTCADLGGAVQSSSFCPPVFKGDEVADRRGCFCRGRSCLR
jgi:hypothetical protein